MHYRKLDGVPAAVVHMHAFPFTVEGTKIIASPVGANGPGWECRIDGPQSVGYVQQTYTYGDLLNIFTFVLLFLQVLQRIFLKLNNKSKEHFEWEFSTGPFPP